MLMVYSNEISDNESSGSGVNVASEASPKTARQEVREKGRRGGNYEIGVEKRCQGEDKPTSRTRQ